MIGLRENHCLGCGNFSGNRKCLAFPEGIPDDLWSGNNLHLDAYPGDSGIRYVRTFDEFPELPEQLLKGGDA